MEMTSSPAFRRRGWIILFIIVGVILFNYYNVNPNLFIIESSSETELKRALVIKALQLLKVSSDAIVGSDNIREYNVTGYRLMSWEQIQDMADSLGNMEYVGVSVFTPFTESENGGYFSLVVGNWFVGPRNSGYGSTGGEGFEVRFHRYLFNVWGWKIAGTVMS